MQKNKTFVSKAVKAMLITGFAAAMYPSSVYAESAETQMQVMAVNQTQTIKGHVVDENGEPMIGVTIKVKNSTTGAVTDANGNFTVSVANGKAAEVTYVGYLTQTVTLKNGLTITMQPDAMGLEDVVVVGYGTMKKRDLTGSIASVKAEEIAKTPTTNVMEAIQGMVAGFDITRSTGEAGADMKLTLRGNRSIYGDNEPLFIIDGMEGSFSELNPNDIASIEVLKDASSTAIYGAAGANGVVIITTKNPDKGKLSVNLDTYQGWNVVSSFPGVRTGEDYINFRREAMKNAGLYTDDASLFPSYLQKYIDNDQWVDWFNVGKQTGRVQEYNLSTSFANDRVNSYTSINYSDTEGLLKGDELKRYSIRAKNDFKAGKYVTWGMNFYGAYIDNDKRNSRIWNRMLCTPPLGEPYDEDGNIRKFPIDGDTSQINPALDTAPGASVNKIRTLSAQPQAYIEITPLAGLSFKSVLGGYFSARKNGRYASNNSWDGVQTGSYAQVTNSLTYNYKWQNILTYNFDIKDNHFTATGVTEWARNHSEINTPRADGFDSDSYVYHNLGAGATPKVSSSYVRTQSMSYVLRLNYSYKGRYLASISNRWDGNSILAEGNKWDSFPAASVGWRISDEPWMQELAGSWLDNLKLRASYGITGNAGASAYATLGYSRTGLIGFQDVSEQYSGYSATIPNLNLGWEKSYSWNIGLDLAVLKNRIDMSIDWYTTTTRDLLFEHKMPYAAGGYGGSNFTMWENVGKTRNTGIELVINSRNIVTKDFNWNTTLTFAANKEKVLRTTQDNPLKFNDYYLISGQPIHSYYMYKYAGIWKQSEAEEAALYGMKPGQIRVEDIDNPEGHKYDANDLQVIGHADPSWTGSLTNNFQYKDFDLSFQLIARWGHTLGYGITGWYRADGINPSPKVCDYYTLDNEDARYPAPNANKAEDAYQHNSSLDYYDGSYIKLKNITLGYTLPKTLTNTLKIQRCRLYFTTTNPFIWTKSSYIKNYDPEKGGDDDDAPLSKQFVVGLNLTF